MSKTKKQNHSERTHAVLSASGSHRWLHCPGSIQFAEQFPKPGTNDAAEEGTGAHELSEKVLLEAPNAFYYIGKKKFNGYEVTEEMAEHVQTYVDHVVDVRNELDGTLTVEERFDLSWLYPGLYGTNDACIRQEFGKLVIIDFKYGMVPVEVDWNSQLLYYALGAAHGGDYSEIELHIVQPRAPHPKGPIRIFKLSPEELTEWSKKLKQGAIETSKEGARLEAGDWCNYCPCAGGCKTLKKRALEIAQTEFEDESNLPSIERLTDEQVVRIVQHGKVLENFIGQVKKQAKERLQNGETIKGLKLVRGRGRRAWSDTEVVAGLLQEKLGDAAFERKLLSVPKAEALLGKTEMVDHWSNVEGSITIAHESDRREAIGGNLEEDFDVIETKATTTKEEITEDMF